MAVGDYVFDRHSPPPMLVKALNCEKWGVGDMTKLPAGMLPSMNIALNYYHALTGYKNSAGRTSEWARRNKPAWEMVSWIIEKRMERSRGNRNQ